MINTRRYTASDAALWDAFVREARNATFLFERAYMDYHQDRFTDHSLLFYNEKEVLVALLPANAVGTSLWSHQGLTYGGFLLSRKATSEEVGQLFSTLMDYARQQGFTEIHYKPIPAIYHTLPSEEEEYFLWRLGAQVEVCNLSSTIDLLTEAQYLKPEYCRRNTYSRLQQQGFTVDWEAPLSEFWPILTDNLQQRYDAQPVHTLAEMEQLQRAFPDQILCCIVRDEEGKALGGTVLFETERVVHTQYSSASPEGKKVGALDFLYTSLLQVYRLQEGLRYFDFGTSNEDHGRTLNQSLIHYKESFGGRGVVYKSYLIEVSRS